MLLPMRTARGSRLSTEVLEWLGTAEGCRAGLLSGMMGGGKTVASAALARELTHSSVIDGTVLWFPLREMVPLTVGRSAEIQIIEWLRFTCPDLPAQFRRLTDPEAQIRCIIMDGLDEAVRRHDGRLPLEWLEDLLRGLTRSSIRVLVTARDLVAHGPILNGALISALREFQLGYEGQSTDPMIFQLASWDDGTMRWYLDQSLCRAFEQDMLEYRRADPPTRDTWLHPSTDVSGLLHIVQEGALTSPLIYRMAVELLYMEGHRRRRPDHRPLNMWEMTHRWARMASKNDGRLLVPYGTTTTIHADDAQFDAAKSLSLFQAISAQDVTGISEADFRRFGECGVRPLHSLFAHEPNRMIGTLLAVSSKSKRFRIFHERLQIHLAAEGMDDAARGALRDPRTSGHSRCGSDRDWIGVSDWWHTFATTFDLPEFPTLVRSILPNTEYRAFNGDGTFAQAIEYWVREALCRGVRATGSRRQCQDACLDLVRRFRASEFRDRKERTFASLIWEALVRDLQEGIPEGAIQPGVPPGPPGVDPFASYTKLLGVTLPAGIEISELPEGDWPVWEWDLQNRARFVELYDVSPGVFLAKHLVTRGQFESYRRERGLRWPRELGDPTLDPHAPIVGVTRAEAKEFAKWLSDALRARQPGLHIQCRLPYPQELLVAARGGLIGGLPKDRIGPFEHYNIIGVWTWTEEENLLIGGSGTFSAPDLLSSAMRPEQTIPELRLRMSGDTRGEYGIRICIEILDGSYSPNENDHAIAPKSESCPEMERAEDLSDAQVTDDGDH